MQGLFFLLLSVCVAREALAFHLEEDWNITSRAWATTAATGVEYIVVVKNATTGVRLGTGVAWGPWYVVVPAAMFPTYTVEETWDPYVLIEWPFTTPPMTRESRYVYKHLPTNAADTSLLAFIEVCIYIPEAARLVNVWVGPRPDEPIEIYRVMADGVTLQSPDTDDVLGEHCECWKEPLFDDNINDHKMCIRERADTITMPADLGAVVVHKPSKYFIGFDMGRQNMTGKVEVTTGFWNFVEVPWAYSFWVSRH